MKRNIPPMMLVAACVTALSSVGAALASSYREVPFITQHLVNIPYPVEELAPAGDLARNFEPNRPAYRTATSRVLEIGGGMSASLRRAERVKSTPESETSAASVDASTSPTAGRLTGGAWVQLSRLGSPRVNERVIGLPGKDVARLSVYVSDPTLPVLLQALFGSAGILAPNVHSRTDLEAVLLARMTDLNRPTKVIPAKLGRLNTRTSLTPLATQN